MYDSVEIYKAQFIFTLFHLAKLAAPRSKGNLDLSKCFKSRYGLFEGSSNSGGFSDKCDASAANNVLGFAKDLFIRVTVSADLIS